MQSRLWKAYPLTYRSREMDTLACWVSTGTSGTVVGSGGIGKSNLLGFFSHRPDALETYLPPSATPVVIIPVDLNNLPGNELSIFYRVILRSFYEAREQLEGSLQQAIINLYLENQATQDPFLSQSALREILLLFQAQQTRVVLVMDRFDKFCQAAVPPLTDTLRGLRDSFKETLCYIVGTRQEIVYLSDPTVLGGLYELLDTNVCWVNPMNPADAQFLISQEVPGVLEDTDTLLALTGGYPALLKVACPWWQNNSSPDRPTTLEALLALPAIQYRLREIWEGLSQAEQLLLAEVQRQLPPSPKHHTAFNRLLDKGFLRQTPSGWRLFSELLATYLGTLAPQSRGGIWLDAQTKVFYQGRTPLQNLSPLEERALVFLTNWPQVRHTKTDIISNTWPDETVLEGVTDDALFQVIRGLRQKIEPNSAAPRYLINWRGTPEGGYQFFPEGRPE